MFKVDIELAKLLSIRIKVVIRGALPKVVSVICPVRNMSGRLGMLEKWISELTEDPGAEVVVVHDLSVDTTGNELKLICEKYDSVTLVHGQFGNPGSARNAGLQLSTGNWVSFWDCDDEPNVKEFLALIDKIESTKPDISFGRFKVFDEISKSVSEAPSWNSTVEENLIIVAQNPGIWRVIFSRDLISEIAFEALRMAEDQIFILAAIMKANKIRFSEKFIYTYFTGSNYHLTKNKSALQDLLQAFNQTSKMISAGNLEVRPFVYLMAARQFISGLKFGTLSTRISLMKSVITGGLMFRPIFLNSIYKSISSSKWGL